MNSINYNKEDIFDSLPEVTNKEYVPFVVNKCLSYFPDTILQSNAMNMRTGLDPRMQFHYLKGSIRKKKRFSKWQKADQNKIIDVIASHYGYNTQKAIEVMDILNEDQVKEILCIEEGK